MKILRILPILFALPFILGGCGTDFSELDSGSMSGYQQDHDETYLVIRDADAHHFFNIWSSGTTEAPEEVNFNSNLVVASVFRRSTGGYSIEVSQVSHNQDDINVNIREHTPSGGSNIQVITYPYVLARVSVPADLQGAPVTFSRSYIQAESGSEVTLTVTPIPGEEQTMSKLAMKDLQRRISEGAPESICGEYEQELLSKSTCPLNESHALVEDVTIGINPFTAYFCREDAVYYTSHQTGEGLDAQGPYRPGQNDIPRNFTQIARGTSSGYSVDEDFYSVVTDPDTYQFFYNHVLKSPGQAPEVDFQGGEVVAFVISSRDTGGYELDITNVSYGPDFTQINVRETKPSKNQVVTYKNSRPYAIARFQLEGNLQELYFTRSELINGQENFMKARFYPTTRSFQTLALEELHGRLSFAESIAEDMTEEEATLMWEDLYPASNPLPQSGGHFFCPDHDSMLSATSVEDLWPTESAHAHYPDEALLCPEHGQYWTREGNNFYGPMTPGVLGGE